MFFFPNKKRDKSRNDLSLISNQLSLDQATKKNRIECFAYFMIFFCVCKNLVVVVFFSLSQSHTLIRLWIGLVFNILRLNFVYVSRSHAFGCHINPHTTILNRGPLLNTDLPFFEMKVQSSEIYSRFYGSILFKSSICTISSCERKTSLQQNLHHYCNLIR